MAHPSGGFVQYLAHRKLKPSESFTTRVSAGAEQFLFVWKGAIGVKDASGSYSAGERDAVFITGPADLTVTAAPRQETRLIHVQAPQEGK